MRMSILNMDAPEHNRHRRLVSKAFTPRMIQGLQESIVEHAVRTVDNIAEKGECEFVEDIAARVPLDLICEMIGLDEADWPAMFELSNKLIGFDDPEYQTTPEAGGQAAAEIFGYCDRVAADRRANPRDDLMSALVNAELDGEHLTDMELNLFFVTLVVAGNETTRNLINHSMLAIIDNPDQAERLRQDPELWPTAVEEMLRWGTSIHNFRRTTTTDTELHGVPIPAGDKVVIYYMSANRDEDVFEDPFRFDITRDPNNHIAFGGGGPHFCLGAQLARLEIRMLFEEMAIRYPRLEALGPPDRLRSNFIGGIKHLPVRLHPTA
jgi:cholest-4-en-3-one 26-monooxygenase